MRLAVLLGADDAEDVVAEAFYQLYRRWPRLRSPEAAAAYLRSVVVNLTRMRIRHLQVVRKHAARTGDEPSHAASGEERAVLAGRPESAGGRGARAAGPAAGGVGVTVLARPARESR